MTLKFSFWTTLVLNLGNIFCHRRKLSVSCAYTSRSDNQINISFVSWNQLPIYIIINVRQIFLIFIINVVIYKRFDKQSSLLTK